MNTVKFIPIEERCAECGIRKSTKLCDFIQDYGWWTYKQVGPYTSTCDMPLCNECAEQLPGHDFCKYHMQLHKEEQRYWHSEDARNKMKIKNAYLSAEISKTKD